MNISDKIYDLSREEILELSKTDTANVGNVVRGLYNECFGISCDTTKCEKVSFFYINYNSKIPGFIIQLELGDKNFYYDLLAFSVHLSKYYDLIDIIGIYNTFINYLRNILEQNDFITITSLELKKYGSKKLELFTQSKIEIIKNFTKENFYKSLLEVNGKFDFKENTNYLYLMINENTGYFKIGHSKKPEYRERTLHSKEPEIKLLKVWECDKVIERKMHKHFSTKRERGEWFKLNIDDLIELNREVNTIANNA